MGCAQLTYLSRVWPDCGLRPKIILYLLGYDLLVDVKIGDPVSVLLFRSHFAKTYEDSQKTYEGAYLTTHKSTYGIRNNEETEREKSVSGHMIWKLFIVKKSQSSILYRRRQKTTPGSQCQSNGIQKTPYLSFAELGVRMPASSLPRVLDYGRSLQLQMQILPEPTLYG
jgi:hypothetical protein